MARLLTVFAWSTKGQPFLGGGGVPWPPPLCAIQGKLVLPEWSSDLFFAGTWILALMAVSYPSALRTAERLYFLAAPACRSRADGGQRAQPETATIVAGRSAAAVRGGLTDLRPHGNGSRRLGARSWASACSSVPVLVCDGSASDRNRPLAGLRLWRRFRF